nr:hypothetical protein [Acanthopleuribacter pedis]
MYFWQDRIHRFHFTWEGREHLFQARERGTGVLLVGAHIGSFDAARALSQDKALPLNVVMYRGHAQKLNAVLNARGPGADINVIELDEHDVDTVFDLESRLARGEIVAVLADRVPPFSKPRTSRVPFLGVPADLPQNVWILAGLLKCPVFFSGAVRTGWRRYHVFVAPMTDRVALPRKQRDEALTGMIEAFAGRMERLCFQYPFQWFNFFSYWSQSK